MAAFTIQTPSGRKLTIDAPDEATAVRGAQEWEAKNPSKPAPSAAGVAEDVAKSAGIGLVEGGLGMVGQGGDLNSLGKQGTSWIGEKLGLSPEDISMLHEMTKSITPAFGLFDKLPTTQELKAPVEDTFGKFYESKTPLGKYARTGAQFIPAVAAGPGSLARKTAQVVVPSVASETAGQLTEGSDYEGLARITAALAGGKASAGGGNSVINQVAKEAPTAEALAQQTDDLYGQLRGADIKYDPEIFASFLDETAAKLKQEGLRPAQAPRAADRLNQLEELRGQAPNFDDLESVRKGTGRIFDPGNKEEGFHAGSLKHELDDFTSAAPLTTNANVAPEEVASLTTKARETASRSIKTEMLEGAIETARHQSSGFENGLRIEFRKILNNPKKSRGFTAAEKASLKEIVDGTSIQNALAQLGKFGVSIEGGQARGMLIPSITAGIGLTGGKPLIGLGLIGAGSVAKPAAKWNAERLANRALGVTRAGKDVQDEMMKNVGIEDLAALIRQYETAQSSTVDPRVNKGKDKVPPWMDWPK